ncbi:Aluminum-activated malate transporter 9 [Ranunculus cassubicifolius]
MAKMGSFRYNFAEKSKERLLSQRYPYSDFGFGSMENLEERGGCFCSIGESMKNSWKNLQEFAVKAWEYGRGDPRKFIFAAKMGLALVIISILVFLKQPFRDLGRYSVWALLTVVVVFEFSIGATLSKGLNRGLGTLSAGGLALAMAELCDMAGEWEEVWIVISIFSIGFVSTFIKLYPTMKPYEYGFRVFLLTYCFIMVSGYRTREFVHTAVTRFILIALGAGVSLGVNIFIYPIWAGEDLHNLVAKNFPGVAVSLEGCVNGYLQCAEYKRVPSKILTYQASADDPVYSGYRSAVESTSQEDALLGFAIWEPPHGPYRKFRYPWRNYVKVSGALRHCAFSVMAMHGCLLSEIQAPAERRQVFSNELQRVGVEGAKVLREIGNKVKKMEKLDAGDILFHVHEAAEELQTKIDKRSYLLVNAELWEIGSRPKILESPQDLLDLKESVPKVMPFKSHSEAVLDLRSVPFSQSWDVRAPIPTSITEGDSPFPHGDGPESNLTKQISWPSRLSVNNDVVVIDESKTYESASALSLATFTSLLIEFVARLQNLVDAFVELGEVADFKEPDEGPLEVREKVGVWRRFCRCFGSKD